MNILFYAPFISASRDTESLIYKLKSEGHSIFFLNQQHSEDLKNNLHSRGIQYDNTNLKLGSKFRILKNVLFLTMYCKRHKIDVVFSHLDPAHSISVFAQYFLKSRFYIVRHHADDVIINGKHKNLFYRLIYKLAQKIIVVSPLAKDVMVGTEGVAADKIDIIPPLYDFKQFEKPNLRIVKELHTRYTRKLKILVAGRLVKNKRIHLAIEVAMRLKSANIDFVMLILGQGTLEDSIKTMIYESDLSEFCHLLGYQKSVTEYISFSDILLHPSISESSSLIVKECGINLKPAIVCDGVGDFNEIIVNQISGVLVKKDTFVDEAAEFLIKHHNDKDLFNSMGFELNRMIRNKYAIEDKFHLYEKYLASIL